MSRSATPMAKLPWAVFCILMLVAGTATATDGIDWRSWPAQYPAFEYSTEELKARWDELHARDQAPLPNAVYVIRASDDPVEAPEAIAAELLEGWRQFHGGQFEKAYRIGKAHGGAGLFLAGRARLANATHMLEGQGARREALARLVEDFEADIQALDREPFHWELTGLAIVYGHYGRTLSTSQAASEGISDKIRHYLDRSLAQAPDQAAALGVYGGYHAEIVDRVGRLVASMVYGATRDKAVDYFEESLKRQPDLIQARVEYGDALLRLWGEERTDQAVAVLERARDVEPLDAEDHLEQLRARRLLDRLVGRKS